MHDAIIEKIRKVLALANGKNAYKGEMITALAKAKEMAMRHGIDLATIDINKGQGPTEITATVDKDLNIRSKYEQPYHRYVFDILWNVFNVRVVPSARSETGGRRIIGLFLIGEEADIAISKEIFKWLEEIFPRILSTAVREKRLTYSMAHTNGCYAGVYLGILDTNKREEEKLNQDDKNKWGLVVRSKESAIDKMMAEYFPRLEQKKYRGTFKSHEAFQHGYNEGRKLNLRQVGGAA